MNVCFMPGFISGAKKKNDRKIRHGPGHRRENLTCKNVMPSCRNFDRRIYKVKKGVQFNLYQCLLSFEAVLQKPTSSEWRVSLSGPEEAGFAPRLKSGLCWGNSIPGLQMAAFPLCPFRPQRESKLSPSSYMPTGFSIRATPSRPHLTPVVSPRLRFQIPSHRALGF